jgi:hypothetical protein
MKSLICDVCKKVIENPVADRNYFHLANRDLCESCHDALDLQIKPIIRTRQPFNYEWYDRMVQDTIEKAMEKGAFDSPG